MDASLSLADKEWVIWAVRIFSAYCDFFSLTLLIVLLIRRPYPDSFFLIFVVFIDGAI